MSFLSILQNDLRTLSLEARKKFPQIKEVRTPVLFAADIYLF
jgi:hypothetical protein